MNERPYIIQGPNQRNDYGRKPHVFEGDIWVNDRPLRPGHARHYLRIEKGYQLRASLRAGDYAWPGGYALTYITDDGQLLCPQCVRENLWNILDSIRTDTSDGWQVIGMFSLEGQDDERCAHCDREF